MPAKTVAPPALPAAAAVDTEAVRAAAAALAALAQPVTDQGHQTLLSWRQIGSCYIAPETPVLLAALDPIGPLTGKTGERIGGLGAALRTFADAAEPVIAELRRLGAGGPVPPAAAARMTALIDELARAEKACAAAIRSLTAFDPAPDKIKVAERVDTTSVGVTLGIVTIGGKDVFRKTTFSDGTVLLTAIDGQELGVGASVGKVIDIGGSLTVEVGSTWRFASGPEADAFEAQLHDYLAGQQAVMFDEGAAAGVAVLGGLPPIRPPDQTISEFGVPLTATVGGDTGVVAGAVGASGTVKETVLQDMAAGTTTTIWSKEGSVEANGTVTPLGIGPQVGVGFQGLTGTTTNVVRDTATGQIVRVVLTATDSGQDTLAGNGAGPSDAGPPGQHRAPSLDPNGTIVNENTKTHLTLTTTTLDVTDGNRAAVEQWVRDGQPDGEGAVGRPDLHYPDRAVAGDAFQNALHDRAKVTRVEYGDRTDVHGIDAQIKAGWTLGVDAGVEQTSSQAGEGTYLDTAGPDDVRHPVRIPR